MPEGHLLHRTASELSADLSGHPVTASSPQGRFDATPVDGGTVRTAEARALSPERARQLWELTARAMAIGRDAGQVVSDPTAPDERWVYKRETCRSCGAPVRTAQVGGRTAYSCPVEQEAPVDVVRAAPPG